MEEGEAKPGNVTTGRALTTQIRRKPMQQLPQFTGISVRSNPSGYFEFLPAAEQIVATPPRKAWRRLAYGLCGFITAAIVWSVFWHLSLFAVAPGQFQASGGSQVVEPLETGQVSGLFVKSGDLVKKDDVILQIDPTAAQAAKTLIEAKLADVRAESVRRGAAATAARAAPINTKPSISWPESTPADERMRQENILYADLTLLAAKVTDLQAKLVAEQSQRDKLISNITAQKTLIDARQQRTSMHEKLASQGWDSRALVLQSQEPVRQDEVNLANFQGTLGETNATIPVITEQIAEARETFIAANAEEAARAERQAAELAEQLVKANKTLENLSLHAPVAGSVQSLAVTNVGQSVKIGEKLMNIVPSDARLEVQAYVLNTDIGFLRVGQPVTLKVDTFPYTRYGTISGKVIRIGSDAVTGAYALAQQKNDATTPSRGSLSVTNAAQQMTDLVFPVTVAPDTTTIDVDGRAVAITPGMSVVAEIETERQRAITYILTPLTRVFSGR